MTKLKKPVTRVTPLMTDNRREARPCDEIAVTLYPGAVIGFRAKRCRKEYLLPLSVAYQMAVDADAREQRKAHAKAKAKRVKRGVLA